MKNYLSLPVTNEIALIQPTIQMAEEIFQLIDSDREHIGQFLDFVSFTKEIKDEEDYLKTKLTGVANGTDSLFLISYKQELAGTIDLHFINSVSKKAEIGYWIDSKFAGKGIMPLVVDKVCALAFEDLGLNKLSIFADVDNLPSNRVALKAGFSFVATHKEDIVLHGTFRDMNHYSLLKKEYEKKQS